MAELRGQDLAVLGLPRSVPVAFKIAKVLRVPLDAGGARKPNTHACPHSASEPASSGPALPTGPSDRLRHMNDSEEAPETEVLTIHECWKYLRSSSIGRLAVTSSAGPDIFPVNYLPENGTLIFRTGPGTKLDAALGGGPVAMEADGLNAYRTIAWSVVVKGHPETVPGNDHDQVVADRKLFPWEPGAKEHLIRITPTEISGRRFAVGPPRRWWTPKDS